MRVPGKGEDAGGRLSSEEGELQVKQLLRSVLHRHQQHDELLLGSRFARGQEQQSRAKPAAVSRFVSQVTTRKSTTYFTWAVPFH